VFEWLAEEMARIKTRKFHLADGPASPEFREAVEGSGFPVPPSYRQFVLQFGNAKLYRRVNHYNSYYLVEVYAAPREAVSNDGERLLEFGRTHTSLAYFKDSPILEGEESPVFEWRHEQGVRQTANGFLEWLGAKCSSVRKHYKKKEWEAIENGPQPFTEEEQAVVEARKRFRWRIVGIAPNGDLRFEVHNGSIMRLPYLFVGVRGRLRPPKSGPLDGGARLPVGSIGPGDTRIIEYGSYKDFVAPEDIEVFDLPDPGPEDREYYWEFKALNQGSVLVQGSLTTDAKETETP
jgi:hypothetical protein